jgi:hypothetical protein
MTVIYPGPIMQSESTLQSKEMRKVVGHSMSKPSRDRRRSGGRPGCMSLGWHSCTYAMYIRNVWAAEICNSASQVPVSDVYTVSNPYPNYRYIYPPVHIFAISLPVIEECHVHAVLEYKCMYKRIHVHIACTLKQ